MDDTRIEKRLGVQATSEQIWDLIADLSAWQTWNPNDLEVSGTIAYGGSLQMREAWPGLPERQCNASIAEWQPSGRLVWIENRGFLIRTLRYLEIEQLGPTNCIVTSGIRFFGLRGELFHDKHKSAIREGHLAIVTGLKAAAES